MNLLILSTPSLVLYPPFQEKNLDPPLPPHPPPLNLANFEIVMKRYRVVPLCNKYNINIH